MRRAGFYQDLLKEALGRWEWPRENEHLDRAKFATEECFGPLLAGTIALNGFQKGDERVETLLRDQAGTSLARVESTRSGVVRAAFPREPFLAPTLNETPYTTEDAKGLPSPHALLVSKVLYHQAEPYLSTVASDTGSSTVGELWDRFFARSEQIPTLALVRTKLADDGSVELCAALTIQGLVGDDEASPQELIESFREDLASSEVLDGLVGENGADWMRSVLPDLPDDFEVKERNDPERGKLFTLRPVTFFCPCSVERMAQSIAGLANDPDEIFEPEQENLEVVCSYCNGKHEVSRDAVRAATTATSSAS
ncbi:Hypothetical Protein FCC1311_049562 [Hondaea fermentalgiana]|uniref:33 kDa chaperonin n=1 Tax=Hondaea fermentalgiana TaxID=2315210 RepID=A0A2R5GDU4_9STRA|nr:Hypothetical Protein FCC1311_049562 [Hondaea fermentalgiana]|eukprot:GBG28735.1 Hypothetical Protein FCC1311_049562 [Hondaea fermentalgiana]